MEPSMLLAYLHSQRDEGPILAATGEFAEEVRNSGWDTSDHEMPCGDVAGLQVFEGWIEVGPGPDPDIAFVGSWRQLTHWEMCRVRYGLPPWSEP